MEKTTIGRFLKLIGAGEDKAPPKSRKEQTGTPTAFQMKWLTTAELIEMPDHDERSEIASMREANWRQNLAAGGFGGIRR